MANENINYQTYQVNCIFKIQNNSDNSIQEIIIPMFTVNTDETKARNNIIDYWNTYFKTLSDDYNYTDFVSIGDAIQQDNNVVFTN